MQAHTHTHLGQFWDGGRASGLNDEVSRHTHTHTRATPLADFNTQPVVAVARTEHTSQVERKSSVRTHCPTKSQHARGQLCYVKGQICISAPVSHARWLPRGARAGRSLVARSASGRTSAAAHGAQPPTSCNVFQLPTGVQDHPLGGVVRPQQTWPPSDDRCSWTRSAQPLGHDAPPHLGVACTTAQ